MTLKLYWELKNLRFVPKAPWRLYHSNRKQCFTFELEEGRVVIEGFVNKINNKLCVVPKARTLRIKKYNRRAEGTPDMNKRMNQHGHIKCCKWVPWQHLDGSWFALYFHRQRNIKFSFWRHILYWYNKINLLVVPKARPLRENFKSLRA